MFYLHLLDRAIPLQLGSPLRRGDISGLEPHANGISIAEVDRHPKDPSIVGLKNLSNAEWVARTPVGREVRVSTGQTVKLAAGTWIDFGGVKGEVRVDGPSPQAAAGLTAPATGVTNYKGLTRAKISASPIFLGRDSSNDIVLQHPMVSRVHAKIILKNGAAWITDLKSTNGTFVNGERIDAKPLSTGDRTQISDFTLIFDGQEVQVFSQEGLARLDAINLKRTLPSGEAILNNVSLSIQPRELVAIVGTSGAGKTTLLRALSGQRPADSGRVYLNGEDFYRNAELQKYFRGFVPQDDIIHRELTVYQALFYSACLRLSPDTSTVEMEKNIDGILRRLEISERKNTRISNLSGGQRKRVSIGVELLTRPKLFLLDEPTSGLDPALEEDLMSLLRQLADHGHTILLSTHATNSMEKCDQVVFLAKGGRLAFFGPPQEALNYFQCKDYVKIYVRLEKEKSPEEWERLYNESSIHHTMLDQRLEPVKSYVRRSEAAETSRPASKKRARKDSAWRQLLILTRRYYRILSQDRQNFALLLLQAPVIGLFLSRLFVVRLFDPSYKQYPHGAIFLTFLIICSSIFFGITNSIKEITKEIPMYARERMFNLRIPPYIFSKAFPLALLCALQSLVMIVAVFSRIHFPDFSLNRFFHAYLTVFLCSIDGMALGLVFSSMMSNQDKAVSVLPLLLIPQLFLAGAIPPLEGNIMKPFSYLTISKFGYESLGTLLKLPGQPFGHARFANQVIILSMIFIVYIVSACILQLRKDKARD